MKDVCFYIVSVSTVFPHTQSPKPNNLFCPNKDLKRRLSKRSYEFFYFINPSVAIFLRTILFIFSIYILCQFCKEEKYNSKITTMAISVYIIFLFRFVTHLKVIIVFRLSQSKLLSY